MAKKPKETDTKFLPEAKYQRCNVYFFCNIISVVPRKHGIEVGRMLKRQPLQKKDKDAAFEKATHVVSTYPDGESALMMVCARLRHVVSTRWDSKKYMDMKHLYGFDMDNLLD